MRSLALSFTVLASLAGAPVLAQTAVPVTPQGVPPGANPATGARPGNDIGTGMSMPMGTHASNINAGDTRSTIAPNLPSPPIGPNANAADYLRAAQSALQAADTAAGPLGADGTDQQPERQFGGVAGVAGVEGACRRGSGADHAVDPVGDPRRDGDGQVRRFTRKGRSSSGVLPTRIMALRVSFWRPPCELLHLLALPQPSRVTSMCLTGRNCGDRDRRGLH
jgi:hypothetical protein